MDLLLRSDLLLWHSTWCSATCAIHAVLAASEESERSVNSGDGAWLVLSWCCMVLRSRKSNQLQVNPGAFTITTCVNRTGEDSMNGHTQLDRDSFIKNLPVLRNHKWMTKGFWETTNQNTKYTHMEVGILNHATYENICKIYQSK